MRTYKDLIALKTFLERYEYLKSNGIVGEETFGWDRILNQAFYTSPEWRRVRDFVITRDNGCDLGIKDRVIGGTIYVHHMNPISKEDLVYRPEICLNPDYLISVSDNTHKAIHYGDDSLLIPDQPLERRPGDTCLWKHNNKF